MIRTSHLFRFLSCCTLALSAASCKVVTDPLPRELILPASYAGTQDSVTIGQMPWEIFYKDTFLVQYIGKALRSNQDLKIAIARNEIARTRFGMAKQNRLPTADLQIGSSVTRFGEYTMNGIGNDDTNRSESLPADKQLSNPYQEWFAGLVFSWEADIWGKLSNRRKAALSRYLASKEFTHGATTWLVSEVATHYFELMGLDQEKKVLEENLALQQLGLELIRIQKAGGKVNQLAVDQFEAQLLNTRAQLVSAEQKILVNEAGINALLGRFPQSLRRSSFTDFNDSTAAFVGEPEQLTVHRPDIRQAEFELAAAHADVNAARAAFFPSLSLSANTGFSAFDLSKWFFSPGSAVYGVAAGVSAPLFQRREIRALYTSANLEQKIALTHYEKAVLSGYHEVYTTWQGFNNLGRQISLKQEEVEVLTRAFNNSNDLFSVGYATYLEVITSQRRMLEAELELTRLKKDKMKMLAILYRALGGGWQKDR